MISIDENGEETKSWDQMSTEERRFSSRKMEVYAGMVDRMDWNIGRVLDHLRATGQLDDTVVMFMSDNGAEGAMFEAFPSTVGGDMDAYVAQYHDNSYDNMGAYDSFVWYGSRWACASTAPGMLYKMFTSEGGIRVPFVMRYPKMFEAAAKGKDKAKARVELGLGAIDHSFATVMDIMPTILDYCGVAHPGTTYQGREIAEMAGRSWRAYFAGSDKEIHGADHVTGWELFGRRAVRQGAFKALFIPKPFGPEKWQLFNVLDDPGETKDLAGEMPDRLGEMIELYRDYCSQNGVINRSAESRNQWSGKV